jgi:Chalcone isomerase-like
MKKIILMMCCVLLSWNASALEVAGVKLPDSVNLGNQNLLLNGAGIRTKWFFKVYVAALYLPKKQTTADAVFADENPQRIALHMLRDLGEKKFLHAFIEAIEANHTKAEMAMLDDQIKQMTDIFHLVGEVKSGDVIDLDYLPGIGTQISVNGVTYGAIAGGMFHRAMLRIWLGKHPVQDDLKKGMLGG